MDYEKLTRLRDNLLDAAVAISGNLASATAPQARDLAAALDVTVRARDPVLRYVRDNKPRVLYSVMLTEAANKIQVIKAIRASTGLSLQAAKEMVDALVAGMRPTVKFHATEAQAVSIVQEITQAGGRAEVAEEP